MPFDRMRGDVGINESRRKLGRVATKHSHVRLKVIEMFALLGDLFLEIFKSIDRVSF